MGILAEPARFVEKIVGKLPPDFSVCELGDQWVTHTDPKELSATWFKRLGCGRYVSIDGNGRGTVTADLNEPLKKSGVKLGAFDLVTDFGTGEHVFDQAQVWRTIHGLTKPGGYIVFDRPMQGYPGHCYYRCDPCLFHDLASANGYAIVRLAQGVTSRGTLVRGIFRRPETAFGFVTPQQGRYQPSLVFFERSAAARHAGYAR